MVKKSQDMKKLISSKIKLCLCPAGQLFIIPRILKKNLSLKGRYDEDT